MKLLTRYAVTYVAQAASTVHVYAESPASACETAASWLGLPASRFVARMTSTPSRGIAVAVAVAPERKTGT